MVRFVSGVLLFSIFTYSKLLASPIEAEEDLERERNTLRELKDFLEIKALDQLLDNFETRFNPDNRDMMEEKGTSEEIQEFKKFYNEASCENYGGQCMPTGSCPGDGYVSNLCPTQPSDIKCCFTADSDSKCFNYGGYCTETSACPGGNSISNYCPTKPNGVKCCLSKPTGNCPGVEIVSRAEWGARSPKSVSQLKSPVKYAFIHHTAGKACSSKDECSSVVRGIQNYHMDSNGWSDIGYSFLVGGDGKIYEGRGWDRVGAHTSGYNSVGLAWSFIGTFTNNLPTTASLDAVKSAIACGVNKEKLTSLYTLRGHRDMGSTSCPGDTLYAEIKKWPRY